MQSIQMQAAVNNSVTRTLSLALSTLGSFERLAQHLGVTSHQIQKWMEGEGRPPTRVYLKALDLVASGPFSRQL
jgi:hypothetical protein